MRPPFFSGSDLIAVLNFPAKFEDARNLDRVPGSIAVGCFQVICKRASGVTPAYTSHEKLGGGRLQRIQNVADIRECDELSAPIVRYG